MMKLRTWTTAAATIAVLALAGGTAADASTHHRGTPAPFEQPAVPGLSSALQHGPGALMINPAHRLWGFTFVFSYTTNASYSGSHDEVAQLVDPTGHVLSQLEFVIGAASAHDSQTIALPLPGASEPAGSRYTVVMSAPPADASVRVNATVIYSPSGG